MRIAHVKFHSTLKLMSLKLKKYVFLHLYCFLKDFITFIRLYDSIPPLPTLARHIP